MPDTFSLYCCRIHLKSMLYGNKIQTSSCQDQLGKEYRHIVCVDGTVFPQSLWGNQQKEPFGIQRVFGGELQTTNRQFAVTRHQQVSRIYQTREVESEVCKGSTEELLGKRNQ